MIILIQSDSPANYSQISLKYEDIQIGSYPFKENEKIGVEILVRHTDKEYVQKVIKEIETNLNEP